MQPTVSTIIVNYHCAGLTCRAAASVLDDFPQGEIIVIDNSDSTGEFALLQQGLPAQVTCLRAPENLGFGRACNLGYTRATGDFILLLNPDAIVLRGCLGELAGFLRETPRAGAAAPLVWWDMDREWWLTPILMPAPGESLLQSLALRRPGVGRIFSHAYRRRALAALSAGRPVRQRMLSGGHVLLRRTAIDAVGGLFDPEFFMYYEDADLCRRLAERDYGLYLLPKARAIHEWCATEEKVRLSVASRDYYFRKHFRGHWLEALRERLESRGGEPRLPAAVELGALTAPLRLSVPKEYAAGWLAEISPGPLLVPAAYRHGQGEELHLPAELWQCLAPGHYWLRVGARGRGETLYHWQLV